MVKRLGLSLCLALASATAGGCGLAPFEPIVRGMDASEPIEGTDGGRLEPDAAFDAGTMMCVPSEEVCNGLDDDCDMVVDNFERPCVSPCGIDGVERCESGAWLGCQAPPGPDESGCDGIDEDCDGLIDEGFICACRVLNHAGRGYQFCEFTQSFVQAETYCMNFGYRLVTIDDMDEQDFLSDAALAIRDRDWYIGLNDRAREGTFVWLTGEELGFSHWMLGEPDFVPFGDTRDCVVIEDGEGAGERDQIGRWRTTRCTEDEPFICESATATAAMP